MSPGVIDYAEPVARWQPDARGRLEQAALALYGERGFENTTVAEIAAQAGLTKRTFFRYYADKREVLFWGAGALEEAVVTGVAAAPASTAPLDAVVGALRAAATALLEGRREHATQRQRIITAHPELQERELIKLARLAGVVAEALRGRGVGDPAAILTAEAGVTVFRVGFERWIDPANRKDLARVIGESLAELRAVTAAA
jgi:AcrR family transcriptional regulator